VTEENGHWNRDWARAPAAHDGERDGESLRVGHVVEVDGNRRRTAAGWGIGCGHIIAARDARPCEGDGNREGGYYREILSGRRAGAAFNPGCRWLQIHIKRAGRSVGF